MVFFSKLTTSEKKTGFLLIELFKKPFNPQNDGHLDHLQVAFYYLSGVVIICISGNLSSLNQYSNINGDIHINSGER
jgi:hypothetical protein